MINDQLEGEEAEVPLPERGLRRWRAIFETERRLDLASFNLPLMTITPFEKPTDTINNFIQMGLGDNSIDRTVLEQFFSRSQRISLDTGFDKDEARRKMALLIDGALHGSEWSPGPVYGPLTASELQSVLSKPRFRTARDNLKGVSHDRAIQKVKASSTDSSCILEGRGEVNVDRRIVYITDLNPDFAHALIATTSPHEAASLRSSLCRHLASDAYAAMVTSTSGLLMFELAFHLPFKALRTASKERPPDPSGQDVSFLNQDDAAPVCIYTSTYSCAITGPDRWRWVVYCFIDTAHDEFLGSRESAYTHHEDSCNMAAGDVADTYLDPCCNGTETVETFGPDPRGYFLRVLEVRLSMTIREWARIAHKIQESVEIFEKVCEKPDLVLALFASHAWLL